MGRPLPARAEGVMLRSFPKARRLRRRSEFQRVYDQGFKTHGRFMTLFVLPNSLDASRLGVAATRKIGGAVDRNRAKRRLREMFRTATLPAGLDMVVVVRRELIQAPWNDLQDEFRMLLGRHGRFSGLAVAREPVTPAARVVLAIVAGYRVLLSPLMGGACRFSPSCSAYAEEALRQHGAMAGSWLALKRLARCHPFGGWGVDPVPPARDAHHSGGAGRR